MSNLTTDNEHPAVNELEGVRARTLAYVNFGLFRELLKLGTSRERICATLSLNNCEYEYLAHLR